MNFSDIFKSSFLNNVTEFSFLDTILALVVALLIGLFIFTVYKKTLTGVMYSNGFALTLVGLSLVTTLVILAVTSNVVLSLGMVGALSIVRFRTAIKEPVEIVFLFWSLAVGIVVGAGMIPLAIIGSVIIGIILFVAEVLGFIQFLLFCYISSRSKKEDILKLAKFLKNIKFDISGLCGDDKGQVVSGGIDFACVDENMQCKNVPGLYFAGECLNADGLCGGFNLHFAFASGYIAGKSV